MKRSSCQSMVESGMTRAEIKAVTGHKSDKALEGYFDNSTATRLLAARAQSVYGDEVLTVPDVIVPYMPSDVLTSSSSSSSSSSSLITKRVRETGEESEKENDGAVAKHSHIVNNVFNITFNGSMSGNVCLQQAAPRKD